MKDHWLPQFYLREFAIPGYVHKDLAEIWQTDLQRGTCSKEKIKDIAHGIEFYSFTDANGKPCRRVDEKLTLLESRAAPAYRELIQGNRDLNNTPFMKKLIALFLATILLRTPDQQQKSAEDHRRLQHFFDALPKSSGDRPLVSYVSQGPLMVPFDTSDYHIWNSDDENTLKQLFAEKIEILGRPLADQLCEKRWGIFRTDKPVFFTGDAPLIKINGDGEACGINTPDAMLFFPLSPSQMLWMTDRKEGEMDQYFQFPSNNAELCNVVTRVNSPVFLFSQEQLCPEDIALLDSYTS